MISLKSKEEIQALREGGAILARTLSLVAKAIKPGVSTWELNEMAEAYIAENGARPSFKGYAVSWAPMPFPSALCVSVNDEVVHGIPNKNRILQEGDIVGIDCGLEYKKMFTDMAVTVPVGKIDSKTQKLVDVTLEALMKGIKTIKPNSKLNLIGQEVEKHVKQNGFSVVRQLVGHGVGYAPHEAPEIPNYNEPRDKNILKPGMVLAIEPMVNMGNWPVETLDDGWTVVTADGSLSAHFEHTVVVTEKGYEIVTKI